eukprot:jgi/Tetstr1/421568/TSEL_012512.t1
MKRINAYRAEYNAVNRERVRKYRRDYYRANAEHIRQRQREFYRRATARLKAEAADTCRSNGNLAVRLKRMQNMIHKVSYGKNLRDKAGNECGRKYSKLP